MASGTQATATQGNGSIIAQSSIGPVADVLRFQNHRIVKNLYKRFLAIVENLEDEHDDLMEKLHSALPAQYKDYANLVDYWTELRANAIRKDILDHGNDTIRQLDEQLNNYEITIKSGKGAMSQ